MIKNETHSNDCGCTYCELFARYEEVEDRACRLHKMLIDVEAQRDGLRGSIADMVEAKFARYDVAHAIRNFEVVP